VSVPPSDRESSDLEALDPIEGVDDARVTRDRSRSGPSKQTTCVVVVGALIATVAVVAFVGTRSRGSHTHTVAVPASTSTSITPVSRFFRSFGTLSTRFGPAVMVCGDEAMPACGSGEGTHLEFISCPDTLLRFFRHAGGNAMDAIVRAFVGRPPPSGRRWSWGCGRDFRHTVPVA